jgi:tetratricopeptide (TPR) repeat protein
VSDDGPSLEDPVDVFLKQADIARQRQGWDDAIKIYQLALKQAPSDVRLHLGLAQSYQSKGDQAVSPPHYLMALQAYWRVLTLDPAHAKANDGILAAAQRAGQLQEVMEEFQARAARHPEIAAYKETFKKIQTILLMSVTQAQVGATAPAGFIHMLMARVAPLASVLLIIGSVVLRGYARYKGGAPTLEALGSIALKTGFFALFVAVGYRLYSRSRNV